MVSSWSLNSPPISPSPMTPYGSPTSPLPTALAPSLSSKPSPLTPSVANWTPPPLKINPASSPPTPHVSTSSSFFFPHSPNPYPFIIMVPFLISVFVRMFKTAVAVLGSEEFHLVAMPNREKNFPCFWCCTVPAGLYNSCLSMLNLRCLAIVFDLDETLIIANTLRSFDDRIDKLRGWTGRERDGVRASGMAAELKRYMEDRAMLKQYADSDTVVVDGGKGYKVKMEEVPRVEEGEDDMEKVVRPVIRLPEKNIVLTRIDPKIRDTSVLVRLRPAWEELRSYLTAKGRKPFEVFVCTIAVRDYTLEMWRLLDPEESLIGLKQVARRVVCVKSGCLGR